MPDHRRRLPVHVRNRLDHPDQVFHISGNRTFPGTVDRSPDPVDAQQLARRDLLPEREVDRVAFDESDLRLLPSLDGPDPLRRILQKLPGADEILRLDVEVRHAGRGDARHRGLDRRGDRSRRFGGPGGGRRLLPERELPRPRRDDHDLDAGINVVRIGEEAVSLPDFRPFPRGPEVFRGKIPEGVPRDHRVDDPLGRSRRRFRRRLLCERTDRE